MISVDAKANKNNKQQEIKIWWLYFTNLYKKYFQNLKYIVKRAYIFHLILVGILSNLVLPVKKRWWGSEGFLLNGQNPLNATKVICR